MNKAIFIDKDGTLITDIPYNVSPALIQLEDDAGSALKKLKDHGYWLILVSNQSGVARGYFKETDLQAVEEKIQHELKKSNVQLDDFFFCPHHPEGIVPGYVQQCDCRKPNPGMIIQAAAKHHVDLERSWMIGDILNDVEAGNRAGCQTILIDNGHETEWIMSEHREPTYVVPSLAKAAATILRNQGK